MAVYKNPDQNLFDTIELNDLNGYKKLISETENVSYSVIRTLVLQEKNDFLSATKFKISGNKRVSDILSLVCYTGNLETLKILEDKIKFPRPSQMLGIPAAFYDRKTEEVHLYTCKTRFDGTQHSTFTPKNHTQMLRKISELCEFTEVPVPFDINSPESINLYLEANMYDDAENSGSDDSLSDNDSDPDSDIYKKVTKKSQKDDRTSRDPNYNRRFKHMTVRNYNIMYERSNMTKQCYKYLVMFNLYNMIETTAFKSYYDFLKPLLITADYKMFNIIISRVSIYELEQWKEQIDFFAEESVDPAFSAYAFNHIRRNYNTMDLRMIFSDFDTDMCKKLWVSGWNPSYANCVSVLRDAASGNDGVRQVKKIIKIISKYYFFDDNTMRSDVLQKGN